MKKALFFILAAAILLSSQSSYVLALDLTDTYVSVANNLQIGTYSLCVTATGNGEGDMAAGISFFYPVFPNSSIFTVCSFLNPGDSVTLTATAEAGSTVSWSGDCSSISGTQTDATCSVNNIDGNKTVEATFACSYAAAQVKESSTYYNSAQEAYNSAADGQTILLQENHGLIVYPTGPGMILDKDISITLSGGYLCDYSSNPMRTMVPGLMIIQSGAVTIENLEII